MLKYAVQHYFYIYESCWLKIELGSIPFNKLSLFERLQPIVFGVTWLQGNINMAAEEILISWVRMESTDQSVRNFSVLPEGRENHLQEIPVASNFQVSQWVLPTGCVVVCSEYGAKCCSFRLFLSTLHNNIITVTTLEAKGNSIISSSADSTSPQTAWKVTIVCVICRT